MLSDPAMIGLIGVIVGAVISEAGAYGRARWTEGEANTRIQAEFLLERKVSSLSNLYFQLEETHRILNDNLSLDPQYEDKYWEEIQPKVSEFRNSVRKDGIYLSAGQDDLLHEALGQFRQASGHIRARIHHEGEIPEQHHVDLKEFEKAYREARLALKEELNEPIQRLDK